MISEDSIAKLKETWATTEPQELNPQEKHALEVFLRSGVMAKVGAHISGRVRNSQYAIVSTQNFLDPQQAHAAAREQGAIGAIYNVIDLLFSLTQETDGAEQLEQEIN